MLTTIKKEMMEGFRTYRFLIILIVFMFFALLNPVMNKLVLPEILKSQLTEVSEDVLNQMLITSQAANVRGYLSDVFEIGTIVVILTLAPLVAGELKNRSFIFPVCSGKSFDRIVISKLIVYGVYTLIIAVAAVLIDYLYAGILFGFDITGVLPVLNAGILQGLYFIYLISIVIAAGSFVRKPIAAGLISLIPAYGTTILSSLFKVETYTPAGLLTEANGLADKTNPGLWITIVITIAIIIALTAVAIWRLTSIELAKKT